MDLKLGHESDIKMTNRQNNLDLEIDQEEFHENTRDGDEKIDFFSRMVEESK
jgi:hypothetical protein